MNVTNLRIITTTIAEYSLLDALCSNCGYICRLYNGNGRFSDLR